MKFVQTLLALALAGSVASAHAVSPGYLGDLVGQDLIVSNTISTPVINTPFTDVYSFDIGALAAETIATSVKISLSFGSSSTPVYDISNFAIALRDTSNHVYAFDNVFDNGSLDLVAILNPSTLGAPGFYEFVVTGNTAGSSGGAYLGALSAAPVPEAQTYTMMLAGLGLIGFTVLRRRTL